MPFYVYMMTNRKDGTLYVGVTRDLLRRVYEHKQKLVDGFTKRYNLAKLVYFEVFDDVRSAIQREKNIKHWPRRWKTALIEADNPNWRDLAQDLTP